MKSGKYTIKELFTNQNIEQIIIPEIQRDYVWSEVQIKGLWDSIVEDFKRFDETNIDITINNENIDEIGIKKMFNEYFKKLKYTSNIGFIYAYNDPEYIGKYFLIDGQQRLTTMYLFLLALSIKLDKTEEFKEKYHKNTILKIDYKVREATHDFLTNFVKYLLDKKEPNKISNEYWYFSNYKNDKTIQSIIKNYETISKLLVNTSEKYWDYLQNFVEFWYFDTSISEQGEELYIYMNARGKQMQSNENLKADLLGKIKDKKEKDEWGKKWESWQDFFWKHRNENESADKGFNDFLRWIQIIKMVENTTIDTTNEDENTTDKKDIIETIKWEKENIKLNIEFLELSEIEQYFNAVRYIFDAFVIDDLKDKYPNFINKKEDLIDSKWLSPDSKTSQVDCFRLLPMIQYCKINSTKIDNHNLLRIARFLFNMEKSDNIRNKASIYCINAIKSFNKLENNKDIICILEDEKISKTILTEEEKFKFNLYKTPPENVTREQLEEIFWKIEDDKVVNGKLENLLFISQKEIALKDTKLSDFKRSDFDKIIEIFNAEKCNDDFRFALIADTKTLEDFGEGWSEGLRRYNLAHDIKKWKKYYKEGILNSVITQLYEGLTIDAIIKNGLSRNDLEYKEVRETILSFLQDTSKSDRHYAWNKGKRFFFDGQQISFPNGEYARPNTQRIEFSITNEKLAIEK